MHIIHIQPTDTIAAFRATFYPLHRDDMGCVMIGQLPKPAAVVVGRVSFIPMGFYTLGLKYVKQPPTASVFAADDTQCCLGRADKHHLQLRATSLMWLEEGEEKMQEICQ